MEVNVLQALWLGVSRSRKPFYGKVLVRVNPGRPESYWFIKLSWVSRGPGAFEQKAHGHGESQQTRAHWSTKAFIM
jgi:hypothetical protein